MNRRSFFVRMLGAACLAAAERIMPAAVTTLAAPQSIESLHRLACDAWREFRPSCNVCGRPLDQWIPSSDGLGISMWCPCGGGKIYVQDREAFRGHLLAREWEKPVERFTISQLDEAIESIGPAPTHFWAKRGPALDEFLRRYHPGDVA